MIYDVYKSNSANRWWAGEVDAPNEASALALAKSRFPSRNAEDEHHVALRSAERQTTLDRDEADAAMRRFESHGDITYRERCAARVQVYKNARIMRAIKSLGNPARFPVIERVATEMEKKIV